MIMKDHIVVIDPGTTIAETGCFNNIQALSSLPCTYHLPALSGTSSLMNEDLTCVTGVIILGGSGNLYDNTSWRVDLENWFQRLLKFNIPVLGICWGHQWIANLFGGKVSQHPSGDKLKGSRIINIQESKLSSQMSVEVVITHGYRVEEKPEQSIEIAFCEGHSNEALLYKDYPIITFQSHPEATSDFLLNNSIKVNDQLDLSDGHKIVKTFFEKIKA